MNAPDMTTPAMTPQQAKLSQASRSGFAAYREFAVGDVGLAGFVRYELYTTLFSSLPGMLGFGARALLFPSLFAICGPRPAIGRGVVLRRPAQISLGRGVMIDDYAALDVRGADAAIEVGDGVSIGRYTTLAAKHGRIRLAGGVNVGSYCRVATQSQVSIEESVLIAAFCYIGPGNHRAGDGETPLIAQEMDIRGGVRIGRYAWIGAHTTILDGVTIGEGAIVGAHSLVREDVPAGAVVAGAPARVLRAPTSTR